MNNPHTAGRSPRILIYRLGSLGDTVVALPSLRLIARAFPDAERWMLTNFSVSAKAAPLAEVLDGTGLVHGYIEYPIGLRDPRALSVLRRRLRSQGFQALVYLAAPRGRLKALRDAVFFRSCGIPRLIGVPYRKDRQRPRLLQNGQYEYEGARLLRCLSALGWQDLDDPGAFDLSLSEEEHAAAARALTDLDPARPIIAASIGAKADVNDWGDDNWSSLLAGISQDRPGAQLVLVGADIERERSQILAAHWTGPAVNLCGRLSVRETAAALARAQLFVGHDSGPMHLAAAVGTPCVAIFSSRNLPGEWFPHGKQHSIFW
jgi:ADP-heptose:LPS heptosyltransferase